MSSRSCLCLATLAGGLLASVAAYAEGTVTYQRLLNPEPQNWLTVFGNYQGWRYSALDQINKSNVSGLKVAFAVTLGVRPDMQGQNQAIPLVNDGFLYVTDQTSTVSKIDVSSGRAGTVLWTVNPSIPPDLIRSGVNRGVALTGNMVIHNTMSGMVMALNRDNGDTIWENQSGTLALGEGFDANPLAVKDMVIVGQSFGDQGTRGWIAGLDGATGKQRWRFNTVPGPGEPGHETWPSDNDIWKYGGGTMWMGPTYDADTSRLFVGTSNPSPAYDPEARPGDNLYTSSTVALNVDTGKLDWYFQHFPNDGNEMDEISPRLIYDAEIDGRVRKVIGWFSKIGYYDIMDRNSGEFISAAQVVTKLDLTLGIDPKTGKPVEYNPGVKLQQYNKHITRTAPVAWCAGHRTASVFPPAYHPDLRRAYQMVADQCRTMQSVPTTVAFMEKNAGRASTTQGKETGRITNETKIIAVDPATGKTVASNPIKYQSMSGPLATKGGVVFAGHPDGRFSAYDTDTLKELWYLNLGTPFKAHAATYAVGGKQYVAILGGSSGASQSPDPELKVFKNSSILWVFSL